jgi:hypothetical protein
VFLQKIYRWTGVKKELEILSGIGEVAYLVIDEPYIHNFVCVVRISEHDIVHLEISMDEGIKIIVVSL